ncbi:unnamed protein product [Peronospora belbahrii]|nr:unnamed protein product [Peronospora belbahrii]
MQNPLLANVPDGVVVVDKPMLLKESGENVTAVESKEWSNYATIDHVILASDYTVPKDPAFRYAKEKDFEAWKDRLQIYGMDFRDLGVIDKFMDHIAETFGSLDILIINATQTIRRLVHYYRHLIKCELAPVSENMAQAIQILRGHASLLGRSAATSVGSGNVAVDGTAIVITNSGSSTMIAGSSASVSSSVDLAQMPLVAEDHYSDETEILFPAG